MGTPSLAGAVYCWPAHAACGPCWVATELPVGTHAVMATHELPPLPFARYTYCCLQQSGGLQPGTNHYACPLPAGAGACTGGGNCNTTCI